MIRILIATICAGVFLVTPAGAKTFVEMFPQFSDLEAGANLAIPDRAAELTESARLTG